MKVILYSIIAFFLFSTACKSGLESIQRSKDYGYKLKKAEEFYDIKQYAKSNVLFEELLTVYKGTKNFESIYYKYANTFYFQKNYLAASYHFKNFADIFPKSEKTEECEYLNSLCLHNLSPNYTLDQTNTVKSIGELQTFVNTHNDSKYVNEANKLIDESREKLETRDAYSANLYYKIREFKAANIAYEQIIRKYPDSKNTDFYHYMMVKSKYEYALNSIPTKQEERLNNALADCEDFKKKYPKSDFLNEIQRINSLSSQTIKKIKR
jgi:outer membrane protein assembly factor BamD